MAETQKVQGRTRGAATRRSPRYWITVRDVTLTPYTYWYYTRRAYRRDVAGARRAGRLWRRGERKAVPRG